MTGARLKYRHLSRSSAHRQALLRNLVDALFEHEAISTTWHKAKEAQRLAEKLITLGKKNTEASKRRAQSIFYVGIVPGRQAWVGVTVLMEVCRGRINWSQSSSAPLEKDMRTGRGATPASCASSR